MIPHSAYPLRFDRLLLGLAIALYLAFSMGGTAVAGDNILPTDIAVNISAQPGNPVHHGETIIFTLAVTNQGPNPVPMSEVGIFTDDILHFFRQSTASTDCPDTELVFYDEQDIKFGFNWHPAHRAAIPVGATLSCHLQMTLLPNAPKSFSFGLSLLADDAQSQNNSAAVTVVQAVESVPTLSLSGVLALLLLTMLCAAHFLRRSGVGSRTRSHAILNDR